MNTIEFNKIAPIVLLESCEYPEITNRESRNDRLAISTNFVSNPESSM